MFRLSVRQRLEKGTRVSNPYVYTYTQQSMWAERKTERSGQKIGWVGAERWADIPEKAWAGPERMERDAKERQRSGERDKSAAQSPLINS